MAKIDFAEFNTRHGIGLQPEPVATVAPKPEIDFTEFNTRHGVAPKPIEEPTQSQQQAEEIDFADFNARHGIDPNAPKPPSAGEQALSRLTGKQPQPQPVSESRPLIPATTPQAQYPPAAGEVGAPNVTRAPVSDQELAAKVFNARGGNENKPTTDFEKAVFAQQVEIEKAKRDFGEFEPEHKQEVNRLNLITSSEGIRQQDIAIQKQFKNDLIGARLSYLLGTGLLKGASLGLACPVYTALEKNVGGNPDSLLGFGGGVAGGKITPESTAETVVDGIGTMLGGLVSGVGVAQNIAKFMGGVKALSDMLKLRAATAGFMGGVNSIGRLSEAAVDRGVGDITGDELLGEAGNILTGIAASMFGVLPETFVKAGLGNVIAQVGGDVLFDVTVDGLIRGRIKERGFKEWLLTEELPQLAAATAMAVRDYRDPNFAASQKVIKQQLIDATAGNIKRFTAAKGEKAIKAVEAAQAIRKQQSTTEAPETPKDRAEKELSLFRGKMQKKHGDFWQEEMSRVEQKAHDILEGDVADPSRVENAPIKIDPAEAESSRVETQESAGTRQQFEAKQAEEASIKQDVEADIAKVEQEQTETKARFESLEAVAVKNAEQFQVEMREKYGIPEGDGWIAALSPSEKGLFKGLSDAVFDPEGAAQALPPKTAVDPSKVAADVSLPGLKREEINEPIAETTPISDVELDVDISTGSDQATKRRGFVDSLRDAPHISDELKTGLRNENYIPRALEYTQAEADAIITGKGPDVAFRMVQNEGNGIAPRVRVAVGQRLINRYDALASKASDAGDSRAQVEFLDKAIDVTEYTATLGTRTAQGLKQFDGWTRLSPAGVFQKAKRVIDAGFSPKRKKASENVDKAERQFKDANIKARDNVQNGPKTRAHKGLIRRNTLGLKGRGEVWNKYKNRMAETIGNRIASAFSKGGRVTGALNEFADRMTNLAGKQLDLPDAPVSQKTTAERIKKTLQEYRKNPEKYKHALSVTRKAIKDRFKNNQKVLQALDKVLGPVFDEPFTPSERRRMVDESIKSMEIDLDKTLRTAPELMKMTKEAVVAKLEKDVGLSRADAIWFSDHIRQEFNVKAAKVKKQILTRMLGAKKATGPQKAELDKLIEADNLGVFDRAELTRLFSEKAGIEGLSVARAAELSDMIKEIKKAPEGFQRNDKVIDMLTAMDKWGGKTSNAEAGMSLWYASILSGHKTQLRNILDTGINAVADTVTSAVAHRVNPIRALGELAAGVGGRGVREGINVVKTGKRGKLTTNKIGAADALEKGNADILKGGKLNPLNYWKFVGRAMLGEDAVWYKGAQQAQEYILARKLAQDEGLKGKELTGRVKEVLGRTSLQTIDFVEQAKQEGLKGLQAKRRVDELREQSLSPDILENATATAGKATYNYDPEGTMGAISRGISQITKDKPFLKFVAPFTRIVANVTNRSLDYTVVGFKRAALGHDFQDKVFGNKAKTPPHSVEERAQHTSKAIIGTTAMALAYMMDLSSENGDDSFLKKMGINSFSVTASGPRNTSKRNQRRESGLEPYTVEINGHRIKYLLTPMAIPFAIIGGLRDAERFEKLGEKDKIVRVQAAVAAAGNSILKQSFLEGVSNWMEIFSGQGKLETSGSKLERMLVRTAGSAIPNLVRQIDQAFDSTAQNANGLKQLVMKSIPFARRLNGDMPNGLGDPVRFDNALFFPGKRGDKTWDLINSKDSWIPMPGRNTSLGDRTMEPNELAEYIERSGKLIRKFIESRRGIFERMSPEKFQKTLKMLTDSSNKETPRGKIKRELLHRAIKDGTAKVKAAKQ